MKKNKELTSVIITCHNYGKYLKKCIDSVINQTAAVKEIIVVNDASEDDSEQVAKRFGDEIQYFAVDFRNGQKTRNFGLQKVTGKYLLFLDADDYLREDCIEKMQNEMEKDDDLYLAYPDRYNIGDEGILKSHGFTKRWHSLEYNYEVLKYFNYIPLPSLIRMSKFTGFDVSLKRFQDWDAWLTFLSDNKKAKRIPECLYFARFHGKNLTVKTNHWKMLYKFHVKRHGYFLPPFIVLKAFFLGRKLNKK